MDHHKNTTDHPKRRRRRRADRQSLSAWIVPNAELKGNIGTISPHLFAQIFPYASTSSLIPPGTRYIAVTPWAPLPNNLLEDSAWTILPVQAAEEIEESKKSEIRFPADSLALYGIIESSESRAFAKNNSKRSKGIEVRLLDVEPLALDGVYVTVNGDALEKHDEVQRQFGGGFDYTSTNGFSGKGKGKAKATAHNDTKNGDGSRGAQELSSRLTLAVREALGASKVVRQNDLLPLPLPAHPITHVPFPPCTITLCEPVRQGLLTETTKIVVNRVSHSNSTHRNLPMGKKALRMVSSTNGDDTSNEQFFSAAENGETRQMLDSEAVDSLSSSDGSENASDESSDDSMQNMISMNTPQLPSQTSGVSSARFVATPRAYAPSNNAIGSPGSVLSNFTTTTARQGFNAKAKFFKARGLLSRIPDELLHPRPSTEEDEEARIFVDMKTLVKIGCFSGDWVRMEIASSPQPSRSGAWSLDVFHPQDDQSDFRPVKVYGLSDLSRHSMPRYPRKGDAERRFSVQTLSGSDFAGLTAWLSPILLANLGQAEYVKVAPLLANPPEMSRSKTKSRIPKIESSSSPPVAREMTLLRISTPLASERSLQTGVFTALKQHFESKRRIVRQGDLIALPVDTSMNRLVAQPLGASEVDRETEELLSLSLLKGSSTSKYEIVWFRVGYIGVLELEDRARSSSDDTWGGAACVEPLSTRMRQAGSESSKIPPALASPWQCYLRSGSSTRISNGRNPLAKYASRLPEPYIAPLRRRLRELLAASTSPQALQLKMDPVVVLLHSTQRNIGKATLASHAASDLGVHVFEIDANDIVAEGGNAGDVKTEALFKARLERAISCGPASTVVLLRHVEALTTERTVAVLKESVSLLRVIILTTTDIDNVSEGIRSVATHELEVAAPDEGEREGILKSIVENRAINLAHDVDLRSLAVKSAALVAGDLVDIVERALTSRQERLEQLVSKRLPSHRSHEKALRRDVLVSGGEQAYCVTKVDFDFAVEAARKNFADAIGAPKIPNVSWDDVGGLENVKDAVMETIQLPLERPELFAKGMKKRSGILFYGPPGTGKTLLAKAIATGFSLNFFSVKGPELLNMYIGESEANVRRVFQRARDARPCVVFFDELDSVAPKRGNQGDSGGVMDRIVSQLLAELDGMSNGDEGGAGVFVIGATNRPDLLDQALLRPGRFDKMLYLGISDTHEKQLTILQALTRKFTMHPGLSLQRVAESLPFTYTGADLYALCSDAMLKAITKQASLVDNKIKNLPAGPVTTAYFFDHLATAEDISVMVTEDDFSAAQTELVGSVR